MMRSPAWSFGYAGKNLLAAFRHPWSSAGHFAAVAVVACADFAIAVLLLVGCLSKWMVWIE
jgi:hypothetical protein